MKTYKGLIKSLEPHQVFVFGSNTQGRHGAGAAKFAHDQFGAEYGVPHGPTEQCYAICTKDLTKDKHPSVSASDIVDQIERLYQYARNNPDKEFLVAYSNGKNLNGYTPDQMAIMFFMAGDSLAGIPNNIVFEEKFAVIIQRMIDIKSKRK